MGTDGRLYFIDTQIAKNKVKMDVPVMTEEEYLASKGFPFSGIGEVALHKGKQKSEKQQDKVVELQSRKDKEYTIERERLREEYRDKVANGEIREPSTVDNLIKAANGHPDLESTQAARRALEKRGIDWEEQNSNQIRSATENRGEAFKRE